MVRRRNPSKGRAWREQRKQVGWELVRHFDVDDVVDGKTLCRGASGELMEFLCWSSRHLFRVKLSAVT